MAWGRRDEGRRVGGARGRYRGSFFTWSAYPRDAIYMAGIFVLAASLWVTEALPLFVTSLVVIGAQIVALANPGGWPLLGFSRGPSPSVQAILNGAADPVLLLFLGGFMLARAAERTDVGRVVSAWLLASLAMALPISTPPNALAYGRGVVAMQDMARIGVTVGALSAILIVAFGGMVMRFWGVA